MMNDETPRDVLQKLWDKYPTSESRKGFKLNEDLIKMILETTEEVGMTINPQPEFATANFSSTALEMFEDPIKQWVQSGTDNYIPSEQILRDLINAGWVIIPPKGM